MDCTYSAIERDSSLTSRYLRVLQGFETLRSYDLSMPDTARVWVDAFMRATSLLRTSQFQDTNSSRRIWEIFSQIVLEHLQDRLHCCFSVPSRYPGLYFKKCGISFLYFIMINTLIIHVFHSISQCLDFLKLFLQTYRKKQFL